MIFCSHSLTFDLYRLTFAFYSWTARQAYSPVADIRGGEGGRKSPNDFY